MTLDATPIGTETARAQLLALRSPSEGIGNVVKFNWPKYAAAALVGALLLTFSQFFESVSLQLSLLLAFAIVFHWTVASLLVSYLVYDSSDLYTFDWLSRAVLLKPDRILNIHAGFDETSKALKILYPNAHLEVFDIYSPATSAEPSIARARQAQSQNGNTTAISVPLSGWSLANNSQDLILVFMSAHELRARADRLKLFLEIHRVLKPDGQCIVVEHLRDLANFIAFGPGFFHFYSRRDWLETVSNARLKLASEARITAFVRVFYLCKT